MAILFDCDYFPKKKKIKNRNRNNGSEVIFVDLVSFLGFFVWCCLFYFCLMLLLLLSWWPTECRIKANKTERAHRPQQQTNNNMFALSHRHTSILFFPLFISLSNDTLQLNSIGSVFFYSYFFPIIFFLFSKTLTGWFQFYFHHVQLNLFSAFSMLYPNTEHILFRLSLPRFLFFFSTSLLALLHASSINVQCICKILFSS